MSDAVKVIGKITVQPDKAEQALSLLRRLAEESRKEKGCTFYEVLEDRNDGSVFILVEEWVNQAALDAHNRTPHVHEAFAKAPALLAKAPDIARYAVVG